MSDRGWLDGLLRRLPLEPGRWSRIGSRQLYILPTRLGWLYTLMLGAMAIASLNYGSNPAWLLTFVLLAVGLGAMLLTWRNLFRLELRLLPVQPVFAGEPATLRLQLRGGERPGIVLQQGDQVLILDLTDEGATPALKQIASHRGWLVPDELTLATCYPLGLLRAWTQVRIECAVLVYPHPLPANRRQGARGKTKGGDRASRPGEDELHGLREFRRGDPLSRVDWKSLARERGLMTKQFHDPAGAEALRIDWAAQAPADRETRLSRMAGEVLEAARSGRSWSLHLPGQTLGPDCGEGHRRACLRALALHGLEERRPCG
ncbi:MAG: DUF58 domain-containing protein [Gammaproteobacteria bacterium]|nr:MAG: DUF58 domain-containing protein [Gammaproteobacteria bacterium]